MIGEVLIKGVSPAVGEEIPHNIGVCKYIQS